jgi:hypothetical protein
MFVSSRRVRPRFFPLYWSRKWSFVQEDCWWMGEVTGAGGTRIYSIIDILIITIIVTANYQLV